MTESGMQCMWRADKLSCACINSATCPSLDAITPNVSLGYIRPVSGVDRYYIDVLITLPPDHLDAHLCSTIAVPWSQVTLLCSQLNLALGKTANSIDSDAEVEDYSYPPRLAVDGDRSGKFTDLTCFHAQYYANPWWMVDLGGDSTVLYVTVWNRNDCCGGRLADYRVGVTNISPLSVAPTLTNYLLCGKYNGVPPYESQVICAEGIKGRYLVIQLEGHNGYLTLCEVEVYGYTWTITI